MAVMTVEDRVTARLTAERATAQSAASAADTAVAKSGTALDTATAKLAKSIEDLTTEAKRSAAGTAYKAQGKALNAHMRACAAAAAAHAKFAALSDDKEFARRVKTAKALDKKAGSDGTPMSGTDAAEVVLLNAGHAMHYTEITRIALETGIVKLAGKTPVATMGAYLAKATQAGDRFVRVEAGVFDLKARVEAPVEAPAETEVEAPAAA